MAPKNGTAKAKAKVAAKPVARSKTTTLQREQSLTESKALGETLFGMVDVDGGGKIQFSEFVELHHSMLRGLSDHVVGEQLTDLAWQTEGGLEKQFRNLDKDHNMTLDRTEWQAYIDSMIDLFGIRAFSSVVETMVENRETNLKINNALHNSDKMQEEIIGDKLLTKVIRLEYLGITHLPATIDLLDQKANPNFVDKQSDPLGGSILYHVAHKCEPSFMIKLLSLGGDASLLNDQFDSAVLNAGRNRRVEVLRVLVMEDPGQYAEQTAESDLSKRLVQQMSELSVTDLRNLVMKGADMNYRNTSGWTPLNSAVFFGKLENMQTLLRLGETSSKGRLYLDMRNNKHRTALHIAARKGFDEAVPLLVNGRADVNARDMDGWTPLHHAVFNSNEKAVKILLNEGRQALHMKGLRGFTPYMLHESPVTTSKLDAEALNLLRPPDSILIAKKIIPILNNEELTVYGKLQELMSTSGVFGKFENLRLYDQIFDPRKGPNKTQLSKMWNNLCKDLVHRLRTGECDVDKRQFSDHEIASMEEEKKKRQEEQSEFLTHWLYETAGPPKSNEWNFENREAYIADLTETVNREIREFKKWFEERTESLKEEAGGPELLALPEDDELEAGYSTQQGAHPILKWLDPPHAVHAFQALRCVCALGLRGYDDMDDALVHFMDLITTNSDFDTPELFWQNVYKLWLTSCGAVMDPMWKQRMRTLIASFNSEYQDKGLSLICKNAPHKTYDQLATTEVGAGFSAYDERTVASTNTDVLRCTLVANGAEALVTFIDFFKMKNLQRDKVQLVRVQNQFHPDVESADGYREVVLKVVFNAGERNIPGTTSKAMTLRLVCEVRITLPDIMEKKHGIGILRKFVSGKMDPVVKASEKERGKTRNRATTGNVV